MRCSHRSEEHDKNGIFNGDKKETYHDIEPRDSHGLFILLVEHSDNEDQDRGDTTLAHP